MRKPRVIGVAAPAGGGKSTVIRLLAATLGDVPTVHFDDYPIVEPADWGAWLAAGADFNAWGIDAFIDAVHAAIDAAEAPFIVVEAPLGRAHAATADLFDTLIFLDVPLAIALARFVRRELADGPTGSDRLAPYLAAYEPLLHPLYRAQLAAVRPGSDHVVDGQQPAAALAAGIRRYLQENDPA